MNQNQMVQVPMENMVPVPRENIIHKQKERYCTKKMIMNLFILTIILFAIAAVGFIGSNTYCGSNVCYFQNRIFLAVGVAFVVAAVIVMISALAGYCSR